MAPSLRRASHRVAKQQRSVKSFAKISKATQDLLEAQASLKSESSRASSNTHPADGTSKRKRGEAEEESETESPIAHSTAHRLKKPKVELPTPPSSRRRPERGASIDIEFSPPFALEGLSLGERLAAVELQEPNDKLPPLLEDLISLHAAFLRAFTVHIVHNGISNPADLGLLMVAITRLWKKHTVHKEDIQRMLAIYELDVSDDCMDQVVEHKDGPFKLTLVGGHVPRFNVEYVGDSGKSAAGMPFNERRLQTQYTSEVEAAYIARRKDATSWLQGEVTQFPRLDFTIGVQTQARKGNAAALRQEVLGPSSPASRLQPPVSAPKKDDEGRDVHCAEAVKNRTISLLDRVRAKSLAYSSKTPQTSDSILRRYALGRIHEVVEILRMKQQRKLSSNFVSSIHASPSKVRGKVAFSMNQLVGDIKDSLAVPIGDQEVRMCISMLADGLPGMWLSVVNMGKVQSVVLNGPGRSGIEVKAILEGQEK